MPPHARRYARLCTGAILGAAIAPVVAASVPTVSGNFLSEVQRLKNLAFGANSNLYVAPTSTQLTDFYDLSLDVRNGNYDQAETEADNLDYSLVDFTDTATNRSYYELTEDLVNGQQTRGWGSYFWNPSFTADALVEVPHTLADENTEDIGSKAFQFADARGFLMAGAHRDANGTGTADVAHLTDSIFLEVHKAWNGPTGATTAWQIHGFDPTSHTDFPSNTDAVLSDGAGNVGDRQIALDSQFESRGFTTYVYNTLATNDPKNVEVNGSVSGSTFSSLGATTNVEGQYSRSIGGTFVHDEMSTVIRDNATNRNNAASGIAAAIDSIAPLSTSVWSGAASTEWNNANNWSPTGVPSTTDAVLFDNSIQPTLPGAMTLTDTNMSIKYLTWNSNNSSTITNATATANNSTLTLNGDGGSNTTPLIAMGPNATSNTLTLSRANTGGSGGTGALVLTLATSGAIDVANAGATLIIDSQITESGGSRTLEKTGDGTLVLVNNTTTGANSFTGGMIFTDGVVSINSFPATGPTPGGTMAGFYTFNGGALQYTGPTPSSNISAFRGITLNSGGGTIDIEQTSTPVSVTLSGLITGPGTLTKTGAGELILGSTGTTSSFTGGSVVEGGILSISNGNALGATPASPTVNVTLDGGTLRWRGTNAASSLNINRQIQLNAGGGSIDVMSASTTFTVSGVVTGGGTLNKVGAGTLALSASNTFTGGVVVDAGIVAASAGTALGPSPTVPAVNLTLDNNSTFLWTSSTPLVTLASSRQVQINSGGGEINVQNSAATLNIAGSVSGTGMLTKAGPGVLVVPNVRIGGLNVSAAEMQIAQNGGSGGTSAINSLMVGDNTSATTAKLDLYDNSMILNYSGTSPAGTVRTLLTVGRNGGSWNGNGIDSTAAANNPTKFALGYGEATTLNDSTFGGQPVTGTAVLIRYTLLGDANLDGTVNALDFNALATHYGTATSAWTSGDFDYNNTVNSADFDAMANNYGMTLPASSEPLADSLGAVVPEPGCIAVLAACAFIPRRRSRRGV